MKKNLSIQLKAALLLIVFSMNTVIGFACAIGVEMGFNSQPCLDDDETIVHVHAEGRMDRHQHEHDKRGQHSHHGSEKGGCCNDKVIKFQTLDKNVNQNASAALNVPSFVFSISNFFCIDICKTIESPPKEYVAHIFHPPPDIRVFIQSFQI